MFIELGSTQFEVQKIATRAHTELQEQLVCLSVTPVEKMPTYALGERGISPGNIIDLVEMHFAALHEAFLGEVKFLDLMWSISITHEYMPEGFTFTLRLEMWKNKKATIRPLWSHD
jgi:hypothetical protein